MRHFSCRCMDICLQHKLSSFIYFFLNGTLIFFIHLLLPIPNHSCFSYHTIIRMSWSNQCFPWNVKPSSTSILNVSSQDWAMHFKEHAIALFWMHELTDASHWVIFLSESNAIPYDMCTFTLDYQPQIAVASWRFKPTNKFFCCSTQENKFFTLNFVPRIFDHFIHLFMNVPLNQCQIWCQNECCAQHRGPGSCSLTLHRVQSLTP